MKLGSVCGFNLRKRILSARDWIMCNLGKNKQPSTCQVMQALEALLSVLQSIFCSATDQTAISSNFLLCINGALDSDVWM